MSKLADIMSSPLYKELESDIEEFVKEKLEGYKPDSVGKKTIRDPVWGSIEYSEWEMQIIDSPLFQRLRDISQVGLASFTYPAARHSRFEHSLGVTAAAKKICERITKSQGKFKLEDGDKNKICLAALLHDIGHCSHSHLSESVFSEFQAFVVLKAMFVHAFDIKPKAHELLSFIIINTNTFKTFFFNNVNYPEKNSMYLDLFHDVGKMIIGVNIEKGSTISSYLTSVINGPFDADKLDYIKRDSLTTGLSLTYDVERLFTKILVHDIEEHGKKEYRLVVGFNGITALEELTFCKIMLHSYIYYHQKVLTAETMIKDYIHALRKLKIIKDYSDLLRYTDSNIFNLAAEQRGQNPFPEFPMLDLQNLADRIQNRRLPKRCFELSHTNVKSTEPDVNDELIGQQLQSITDKYSKKGASFDELEKDISDLTVIITRENPVPLDFLVSEFHDLTHEKLLVKRKEFYDQLIEEYRNRDKTVNFTMFDVYIAFPKHVNFGIARDKVVLGKDTNTILAINDFVKLDDWAESFNTNKWRGYVFITEKIDTSIAFMVAEKFILKGKAKIINPSAYIRGIDVDE